MGDERLCTLALAMCPSVERRTLHKLITGCGGAEQVWKSPTAKWTSVCAMREKTVAALDDWRKHTDSLRVAQHLAKHGIYWSVPADPNFPQQLLDLDCPPILLFSNRVFDLQWFDRPVSIVGTRRASAYAVEAARWVAETVAVNGYVTVSGMALGVDAAAHAGALNAQSPTIAVVACGVDVCYPPQNRTLYQRIRECGMILSEYPPGSPVAKWRFPERNRLIAALSPTLVIVQAGDKSGALHTVDAALDLGRDVYVVPGPITSKHFRGSNRLIQNGAQVLVDPVDIVTNSGTAAIVLRKSVPERWRVLYEAIDERASAVSLAQHLSVPLSHVYAGLLELEVAGLIRRGASGSYERLP